MTSQDEPDTMMATASNRSDGEFDELTDEDVWYFHLSEDARMREAGLTRDLRRTLLEHYHREDAEKAARSRRLFGLLPVGFLRQRDDGEFFILPDDDPPPRQRATLADRPAPKLDDFPTDEDTPSGLEPEERSPLTESTFGPTRPAEATPGGAPENDTSPGTRSANRDEWSTSALLAAEALDSEPVAVLPRGNDVVLRYSGTDDWSTDWLSFDINEETATRTELTPEPAPVADNVVVFQRPADRDPEAADSTPEEPSRSKWDEMIEANRGQTSIVDAMREMWSGTNGQPQGAHRPRRLLPDESQSTGDTDNVVPFTTRLDGDSAPIAHADEAAEAALNAPDAANETRPDPDPVSPDGTWPIAANAGLDAADLPGITPVWDDDEDDGLGNPDDAPMPRSPEEGDRDAGN